jgi:hypothetical protein
MDVHAPSAITEGLRRRQIDVVTSQKDGTRQADDEPLLRRATELGRVLVSQDEDLSRIAHVCQDNAQTFSGLIFSHQGSASIGTLISDMELISECCAPEELRNRVIYLPMR